MGKAERWTPERWREELQGWREALDTEEVVAALNLIRELRAATPPAEWSVTRDERVLQGIDVVAARIVVIVNERQARRGSESTEVSEPEVEP